MSVYNCIMLHDMYIKTGHLHMQLNNDLDDMRSDLEVKTRWGKKCEDVGLLHLHMQHYMSRQATSTSSQTHHPTMHHKHTCTPQTPTNTCAQFNASLCSSPCMQSTRTMKHMLEVPESQKVSTGQNSMMVERRESGQGRFLGAFVSVTATADHGAAMCDVLIQTLILATFLAIWLVSEKCTKHWHRRSYLIEDITKINKCHDCSV